MAMPDSAAGAVKLRQENAALWNQTNHWSCTGCNQVYVLGKFCESVRCRFVGGKPIARMDGHSWIHFITEPLASPQDIFRDRDPVLTTLGFGTVIGSRERSRTPVLNVATGSYGR